MNYNPKYYIKPKRSYNKVLGDGRPGRPDRPEVWITGPDPIEHDKYYGWKKHQSQARFRGEEYEITWEDWQQLWTTDLWLNRGRHSDNYTMYRCRNDQPWNINNVVICLVKHKGQYYDTNRKHSGPKKK